MRILRVEHTKSGKGPYIMRGLAKFDYYKEFKGLDMVLNKIIRTAERKPTPCDEGLYIKYPSERRCGFRDSQQLKAWFTSEELQLLYSVGFVVVEYLVEPQHVQRGLHQIVFDSQFAKRNREVHLRGLS